MDRNDIPDVDNLQDIMNKCLVSNANEPDAQKFFNHADKLLSQEKVNVLRVSDHGTIGLEGSATCDKGTSWSRLVKENGSSNKGQNSGGSFGIGKSAAFACSDLRTIFYSSVDRYGLQSNFGVAKLVSYEDPPNGWTTGVGYYSEDDNFVAIPEVAQFDKSYIRNDSGTDIYILGMHEMDKFKEKFIQAVLLDFLVALVQGKLKVAIQDEIIDRKSLSKYIANLNPYGNSEIKDLIEYYHLLTSADPTVLKIPLDSQKYGKDFNFQDGECTLYLKEGEGFNRRILVTRNAGMKILELNRISGSIEFTGVLIIDGLNMNERFKAMEVPSHDAWEPGRCRDEEKLYTAIYAGLKKYVKQSVLENFGKVDLNIMDAIGANDFLPDKIESDSTEKKSANGLVEIIRKILGKEVQPQKKKSKSLNISEKPAEYDTGTGAGPGLEPKPDTKTDAKPNPGPSDGTKSGNQEGDDKTKYKEINVKKRLFCKDASQGTYKLRFIAPTTASKIKLEFKLSGEQSDVPLPINSANVVSTNQKLGVKNIAENIVYLKNTVKGEPVDLEVNIDFDSYCMMEVDYYANKK